MFWATAPSRSTRTASRCRPWRRSPRSRANISGALLAAEARGRPPGKPFRFRNRGNTAIVGRNAAVFDFGKWQLKGRFAWFLWALVHVYLLVGFENRLQVVSHWLWSYLTYERGARLIMPDAADRSNS